MTHPNLTLRTDRRPLLVAAAAALLVSPAALATSAAGASLAPGSTAASDCSAEAASGDLSLTQRCVQGEVESSGAAVPDASGAVDPIEQVVDGVLKDASSAVDQAVEQVAPVVDDVAPAVEEVAPRVEDVAPAVGDLTEAVPAPAVPTEPQGPPPVTPSGSAAASPGTSTRGLLQGPGLSTPPFLVRGSASDTTTTPARANPFASPVVTGPVFANLPHVIEEFLTDRSPITFSADAFAPLRGADAGTVPAPDAPTWLLATAGGMLLLVGAGHILHARQRSVVSVAR